MAEDSGRVKITIEQTLRTRDDKVFFPGEVEVDKRTAASIRQAQEDLNEVQRRREMAIEEQEGDNELGDTRTSAAEKKAAKERQRVDAELAKSRKGK